MLKGNKSIEQAAEDVLRGYLLRCFSEVSKQCPAVTAMNPEDGVAELLKLRKENKITIELTTVETSVKCTIQYVQWGNGAVLTVNESLKNHWLGAKIDAIKEQIAKTETILAESRENFEKNPESLSFDAR